MVTERGLPLADGATACPFVAFEDDRDERASAPDHRHRCYAEQYPAPRALAHQEAYCLSTAFPVCPTFQSWARREAARARDQAAAAAAAGGADAPAPAAAGAASAPTDDVTPPPPDEAVRPAPAPASAASATSPVPGDDETGDDDLASTADRGDEPVQRNPPRDWAAPPPWLASNEARRQSVDAEAPAFLGRQPEPGAGLAGSAADQLAGGPPPSRRTEQVEELWGEAATGAAVGAAATGSSPAFSSGSGSARPAVPDEYASVEAPPGRVPRRPRAYDQHLGGPNGPDWEQPKRYEAYPTIRTRIGMPEIPRIVFMAVAVGLLAIFLLFLPSLLNFGGTGSAPGASPSPSGSVKPSFEPTPPPAPTPLVYTVKKGDTLTKIAKAHGLTLDELLAANPAIKNPNKVTEGQQIVIPLPSESAAAPAPSAARSPARSPAP